MKKIRLFTGFVAISLLLVACGEEATQHASSSTENNALQVEQNTSQSTALSGDTSESLIKTNTDDPTEDPSLDIVLNEVQSKFKQLSYTDEETGVTLAYNLYVPEDYDEDTKYPMVSFIHDDSVVGSGVAGALTQGYGGAIWATEAEQAKHASFVLVPYFETSTVEGGMGQSGSSVVEAQVQTYYDLLQELQKEYSIDTNRLYQTGQSMGGMTSFYLNATYSDLFAATLYVSSQWDVNQLNALENQKFFYIVAGGDNQAMTGQTDLMNLLENDGISYSTAEWDAVWSAEQKNTAANEMIGENTDQNFVHWATGSVLTDGENMEHMASFDYGYTVPAVRNWLFNQSKADER
ncbi:alpha/beta hydrolase-fold protein [Enterococcus sp. AZ192]|uniref:carboxylesterase family protein n=1 Tax=unclassified Enterococcus TaxID=2608891 RepID=UPI003D2A3598